MFFKTGYTKHLFFFGVCVILAYLVITSNVSFRRTTNAQNVRKYILPKRPSHTRLASPHDNDHPSNTHLKPPDSDNRILTSKPQHQSVIILTYMRSGSSLLGDIIQHSPGAFYLYEPLHSLGRVYTHFQTNLTFVNGTVRMWPFDYMEEAVNIIRAWLNCDTTRVLTKGLRDGFMEKGINSRGFRACVREFSRRRNMSRIYMKCALKLREKCKMSSLRVMKTIRISMKAVSQLMSEFPELKIIHLIRDARATLMSQSIFGMCGPGHGGFEGCSNSYCSRLEDDILESEILQRKYPKRIKTVHYEKIAMSPLAESEDLYEFLGTEFTKDARDYVYNITQAGKSDNCAICTTRQNSTEHIDRWRNKIKDKTLEIIERRCNYVLQRFNHTLYSNYSFIP